jgi:4-amino-4-deoxy-L-arabinose transferase-like glycosyltransferase
VVPTFNGELRGHKPVLLYWLIMTAYAAFGVNEFAARFWSAALATGTVLVTYAIGCRLFDARAATWSALILATTLMFNVAAHAATPDATLIFCTTLAMALVSRAVDARPNDANEGGGRTSSSTSVAALDYRWLAAAGASMGAGVLAKGPIGFVLPVAVWVVFALFCWYLSARRAEPLSPASRREAQRGGASGGVLPALLVLTTAMLAVALPWYVLVGVRTDGAWLREFFLEHHLSRAMSPMEGHGGNAFLYYPISILVGFFPWSALTIPVSLWVAARRDALGFDRRFAWLLSWLVVYVVAFSLAGTKLPSYVTPTYPAIALMTGHFVAHWPRSRTGPAHWWPHWSAATLVLVGLAITIALPWLAYLYLPQEQPLGLVGLILLVGGIACELSFRRCQLGAGLQRLAVTALAFIVALFGWVAPRVSEHQQIEQLLRNARRLDPQAPMASWAVHEPSWVFYAGRSVPLLANGDADRALNVLERQRGFLITSGAHYEQLKQRIGPHGVICDEIPYFLRNDDLLLISPPTKVARHSVPRPEGGEQSREPTPKH